MIGLDTNVLVRYIVADDDQQFEVAQRAMRALSPESPGFITQVTLVELYWVLSRSYRLPRETCLRVIRGLVETAELEFDDGEGVVRALTLAEDGVDFGDAMIHGALELFGIDDMITFDRRAARRLGWTLLDH